MGAMESVERYEEGVAEAQRVLKWYPNNPLHAVEAHRALGRCQAKLGRTDEAETAFQAAVAEAKRAARPYHEMLAISDYIQAVLDPAGRRKEQLPALGRATLLPPRMKERRSTATYLPFYCGTLTFEEISST